jgi:hypothetical protein
MRLFLDALSDASAQMTGTLTFVGQAFEAGWGRGLEALLDRPATLFYLAAFAAGVVFIMGGLRGAGRAGYQRGRFLTTNEKSFLMTLDAALGRNYRAFAQVRLAELVSPTLGANPVSRRQALNGVMAKSVDFVICDVLTLDPVAAIEVDDRSHLLPPGSSPCPEWKERTHENPRHCGPCRWRGRGLCAPPGPPGSCARPCMDSAGGSGARLRIICSVIIVGETCRSAALDRRVELGRQTAIELDGIALERALRMGAGIGPISVEVAHRSFEHALGGVGRSTSGTRSVRPKSMMTDSHPDHTIRSRSCSRSSKAWMSRPRKAS